MKTLTRIMKLTEEELREIVEAGEIFFTKGSSWSGEERGETYQVAEHFDGLEILFTVKVDERNIERPEDYEKYQMIRMLNEEGEDIPEELEEYSHDCKCDEDLDEWLNKQEWTLKINNEIIEQIKEDGFEAWLQLQDTGIVEIDLVDESLSTKRDLLIEYKGATEGFVAARMNLQKLLYINEITMEKYLDENVALLKVEDNYKKDFFERLGKAPKA